MKRSDDLIFDVGAHNGQDSAFYLKKGFRVVGIEANPELCKQLRYTFSTELATGQFTLVEAAISSHSGRSKFYMFGTSVFGTISMDWADRNRLMGLDCQEIDVESITAEELFRRHGVPYFLKADIEGADMLCIEALAGLPKPKYLSMEAEKHDLGRFECDTRVISDLGYSTFQLLQQEYVPFQRLPVPSREGKTIAHRFPFGASGMFGKDLPAKWVSLNQILAQYRLIARRHRTFGDYGLGRTWVSRQILRLLRLYPGWHDLHACFFD